MISLPRKRDRNETEEQKSIKQQKVLRFVTLNYDVLIHIFGYLDKKTLINVALVCRDWKTAAYNPTLWKKAICTLRTIALTYKTAKSLNQRSIKVVKSSYVDKQSFAMTLSNCANVVKCDTLYLSDIPADRVSLPHSFHSLKHLAVLVSMTCLAPLRRFLSPMVNLQQLHINSRFFPELYELYKLSSYDYLEVICTSLPNLKDLELDGELDLDLYYRHQTKNLVLPQLQRLVFDASTYLSVKPLPSIFPGVKHLTIHVYKFPDWVWQDKYVSFQSLESLKLGTHIYGDKISSPFIKMFNSAHNLRALHLTSGDGIDALFHSDDDHFTAIIESLPNIVVLIYGHAVGLKTVNRLMAKMGNLEILSALTNCDHTQEDFSEFIENVETHTPKLFSLLYVDEDLTDYPGRLSSVRYICSPSSLDWPGGILTGILKKVETRPQHIPQGTSFSEYKVFEWLKVTEGSADWHEAVGTSWFTLPDTLNFGLCKHHCC